MIIHVVDDPSPTDVRLLDQRLDEALLRRSGHADVEHIAALVHDDQQRLIAGASASLWGGCCEVTTLWVDEAFRGDGLGTRLLRATEGEAQRRGCGQVVLFTHCRQPPTFYLRQGYEVVGCVPDYPQGSTAVWLRKPIAVG